MIDSTDNYVNFMKEIFDFRKLKNLLNGSETRAPFKVLIDSMNAGNFIGFPLVNSL